mmetsp:Transcript_43199/g.82401  ORF Transcript_43199/g.82401 Transcript_43199/m.82401 type:complete len:279 (+) Transcript_43199:1071-1907(+)
MFLRRRLGRLGLRLASFATLALLGTCCRLLFGDALSENLSQQVSGLVLLARLHLALPAGKVVRVPALKVGLRQPDAPQQVLSLLNLAEQLLFAVPQLGVPHLHHRLARCVRALGCTFQVKVRASLQQSFLGGAACPEHLPQPALLVALPSVLGAALHRLHRLHLHRLQMMLQLHVDGALGGGQEHVLQVLLPRDLVNLRHVLPHEPVQEGLRQRVATRVPGARVHLSKVMELLHLGLLLFAALRRLVLAQVHAQERSHALDIVKVLHRRGSRQTPAEG